MESIVVLTGVVIITFFLMNIIPGNAATAMIGKKTNQNTYDRVVKELNLDQPLDVRFKNYGIQLLRGDFGKSIVMNKPVVELISEAFPNTMILTVSALIFAWILGILSGVLSAMYPMKLIDRVFTLGAVMGISVPTFWIAIILQYIFSYKLKLLPISGFGNLKQLILPSIVLGWSMAGEISRLLRANLLENMENEFLDLARSKGRSETGVLILHCLKISMLPVMTIMVLQFTSLLGGAMITEGIFGIPGIGTLSISALTNRDLPVLQGTIILGTFLIVFGNLIADIIYSILDPRIRLE